MRHRSVASMVFTLRAYALVRGISGFGQRRRVSHCAAFIHSPSCVLPGISPGRSPLSTGVRLWIQPPLHISSSPQEDYVSSMLQKNGVISNELNENCLLALRRCPGTIADNALNAYVKQKRRREANGIDKISDPSNYVLAVLRNTMAESNAPPSADAIKSPVRPLHKIVASPTQPLSTSSQSSTMFDLIKNNARESDIFEEEASDSLEIRPLPLPKKSITTPKSEISSAKSTEIPPRRSLDNRRILRADTERISMIDFENCLNCLVKLEKPIIELSGVGPKTEAAFHSLGLFTLRDFLWFFPRYYIDRSHLQNSITNVTDGDVGTFLLAVGKTKSFNSVACTDEAGNDVDVTFFYGRTRQGMAMANAAIQNLCKNGTESMIVSGKVTNSVAGGWVLFNPDVVIPPEQADSIGIEPVYSLASGLTQKKVVAAVEEAMDVVGELFKLFPESLPDDILAKVHWPTFADALVLSHKPTSMEETKLDSPVRQRIAFEELSIQQARLALTRWNLKHFGITHRPQRKIVHSSWRDSPLVTSAISALPFKLTSYQMKCLEELWGDAIVGNDGRMLRLLQGDVGSGKTVLAYLLGLGCIESRQGGGRVTALMCPTQLLAAQHVQTISDYASRLQDQSDWKINVELLTGTVIGTLREDLLARLESSNDKDAVFLIGTRALVTPDIVTRLSQLPSVSSDDGSTGLALAVVDEEQRFGVLQRLALTKCAAHSLYMSATPIPRSVSLRRSALVDFTVLASDPRSVATTIVSSDRLDQVLSVLDTKIKEGSKCFWVLPRIGLSRSEDNDEGDGDSATSLNVISRFNMLKTMFGEERVCHVHGKMAQNEREEQVGHFADPSSEAAILVGTTVIEVGIDIPDTNILIVEDADRFGLSQLHQLRGRIGRAGSRPDLKCSCILLSNVITTNQEGPGSSLTRLQILQKSNKGEEIADADFFLRGPGDMLGVLQSGMNGGHTVDLVNHWNLLDAATRLGRSFLQRPTGQDDTVDMLREESETTSGIIMKWLAERDATFNGRTSASMKEGLALRIMIALFSERKSDGSDTIEAINTLQSLDASKSELSQEDKIIHTKIVGAIFNERHDIQHLSPSPSDQGAQMLPLKPYVLNTQVKRVNLVNDDVVFVVLDCETTGLDEKSCHIIQLAAKVLGSDDNNDLFSEYILPPIPRLPSYIEEMTGITDEFLRKGGFDQALGKKRDAARDFRHVYLDFQTFCTEKANGREIVFVAHNAKFDVRMINGELRRWRLSEYAESAPVLGETFACYLDTLQLFRDRKWWRSDYTRGPSLSRPSSFSLSELHSYVFNESMTNSHNAVGDIMALERLLLSKPFVGWETTANKIQIPFVKIDK